jgi:hypothetical protein
VRSAQKILSGHALYMYLTIAIFATLCLILELIEDFSKETQEEEV